MPPTPQRLDQRHRRQLPVDLRLHLDRAWAQHTGIAKVEVRLDGQAWRPAELGGVPNADTWVQWAGLVDAKPGHHELVVRATDTSGYTQTSVRTDVVPDGATGWHRVSFSAG